MKPAEMHTSKLRSALLWLDDHILLLLTGFLMAFIPLYPKLPVLELITGYIVRVRIEDFFIAFTVGVWVVQVIRKKVAWKTPLTLMIALYLIAGLLSSFSAMFWTQTVPLSAVHVQKLFLHYFRRIEYFSLFFIAYASLKDRKQLKVLLGVLCITAFLVSLYGLGQKYLYWPVYSTMNREFSKGLRLYLTEHARVQSTFGGHYDYAAWLVVALPMLLAFAFTVRKMWVKLGLYSAFLLSLWGLMMTSSRSSFLAYIAAATLLVVIFAFRKGWLWGLVRIVVLYGLTAVYMIFFGDLLERFGQIFKDNSAYLALQQSVQVAKDTVQAPIIARPKDGISIEDVEKAAAEAAKKAAIPAPVVGNSDTQPTPLTPQLQEQDNLPPDVFENIPDKIVQTKTKEGKDIEIIVPRVFSENAYKLGLSAAIRLDTLWPLAIRGFLRNPLLGSGYSTLTKYEIGQFTEAESTDNDFLRTLGETGLVGFVTFYGVMVIAVYSLVKKAKQSQDRLMGVFAALYVVVTLGLMINAVYIDVFVSSKVAQTYWILTGLLLAYSEMVPIAATQMYKTSKNVRKGRR
ncbi:MAG TPA: hypothetical protein VJ246_01575 [Patescibacteria group bacterium]|nr:hypothetical protein [Patescibacteria group bacterium]